MFLEDAAGVPCEKNEALRRLHQVANAPLFGYFADEFGMGPIGALAVAVGAAGALRTTVPGRALSAHPTAILAAVAILTVAGTAFQLSRAWGRGGDKGPKRPAPAPAPVKGAAE